MPDNTQNSETLASPVYYPRLLRRIQATLLDSLLVVMLIYAIAFLPPLGNWSFIKPALFVAGLLVLEPVLVSFTGGSIGHHWRKIRVTRISGDGNIDLFRATIRFILKITLGWFSLIVVMVSRRHQALHDLATQSLVVHDTSEQLPAFEKLEDRANLNEHYEMPSRTRRVVIIFSYIFLEYLLYTTIVVLIVSESCLRARRCSITENIVLSGGSIVWTVAICLTIVFGWRGQIYGCRRSLKN